MHRFQQFFNFKCEHWRPNNYRFQIFLFCFQTFSLTVNVSMLYIAKASENVKFKVKKEFLLSIYIHIKIIVFARNFHRQKFEFFYYAALEENQNFTKILGQTVISAAKKTKKIKGKYKGKQWALLKVWPDLFVKSCNPAVNAGEHRSSLFINSNEKKISVFFVTL